MEQSPTGANEVPGSVVSEALARAAEQAALTAARWAPALTASDRRSLIRGFHRAEALAEVALRQAAAQVPRRYRDELAEQLEDERRHVALFSGWLGEEDAVLAPAMKRRPWQHWFASLLLNELTGFCQFHLLAALLEPQERAQVLDVIADERHHVERLVRWLDGSRTDLDRSVHRFLRALDGRMRQFFPREDLSELRASLGTVVARLLGEVAAAIAGSRLRRQPECPSRAHGGRMAPGLGDSREDQGLIMTHQRPAEPGLEDTTNAEDTKQLAVYRARYKLLCDAMPNAVMFHDGSVVLDVAGDFHGLLGWTAEEARGQPVLGPWVHDGARPQIRERIAHGFQGRYQTNAQHKDGTVIPVELHVRQEEFGGAVVRVVVFRDLRESIAVQTRLAEGDARFRTLLEVAFDGMVVHRNGYVLETNEGFARMVGARPEQVIGMTPGAVVTPESVPIIMEQIRTDSTEPYEVVGRRPDGTRYPMQIQGRKVPGDSGIRVTGFRDLTRQREAEAERHQLQQQLLQAQKLEGLGIMAGGIAHDFNNLLTVILGNADLALSKLPGDHPVAPMLSQAIRAASRAAQLTRQMLSYAGRVPSVAAPVDVSAIVRETSQLLAVAVPKGAAFELDLAPDPVIVRADRGQLEQVVMNLITNAAEALPAQGGSITLRTRREDRVGRHRRHLVGGTTLPQPPCALVEVVDTGSGIEPGDMARIFDPFYSTRFQGRGLGLATVLGIVRAHEGAIAVESTRGAGTRFSVLLPLSTEALGAEASPPPGDVRLRGDVVLVDDEPEVADVAAKMIRKLGGSVEVLDSGEALLERLNKGGCVPRVVVIDRIMPGMGGDAAKSLVRERWPELPILMVSGRERPPEPWDTDSKSAFLPKPFQRTQLIRALHGLGVLEADADDR